MPEKRGRKRKAAEPAAPVAPVIAKVGPTVAIPDPPGHLEGLEVEAWKAACLALVSRGSMEAADLAIVEQFAMAYAMGRRLREQLKDEPLSSKCRISGRTFTNPLIALQSSNTSSIRSLLIELGLTPRSRKSPQGSGDESDPMDDYLKGPTNGATPPPQAARRKGPG